MKLEDVVVATMTRARDHAEAQLLEGALRALQRHRLRVAVTDRESIGGIVKDLARESGFIAAESNYGPGLVGQVKSSIAAALNAGAEAILYTEPDKAAFF